MMEPLVFSCLSSHIKVIEFSYHNQLVEGPSAIPVKYVVVDLEELLLNARVFC